MCLPKVRRLESFFFAPFQHPLVPGSLVCALATQHLQVFAHCLNMLSHNTGTLVPIIPQPRDFVHVTGADFSLSLAPDRTKVSVDVVSASRDAFGVILSPTMGRPSAVFALTLGVPCEAVATLVKWAWRAPELEVVLHSAAIRLDNEALFGWLLVGLGVLPAAPEQLPLSAAAAVVAVAPDAVPAVVSPAVSPLVPLYDMFTWAWSVSVRDVELSLGHGLQLRLPSIEMRPSTAVDDKDAAPSATPQPRGHAVSVRKLALGSVFGPTGLGIDLSIHCECAPPQQPVLRVSLFSEEQLAAQLAPMDVEGILQLVADLGTNVARGGVLYAHCWGPALMRKSEPHVFVQQPLAARPIRQARFPRGPLCLFSRWHITSAVEGQDLLLLDDNTPSSPPLGVAVDLRVRFMALNAALNFPQPASQLLMHLTSMDLHLASSAARADFSIAASSIKATFTVASDAHQMSLSCSRFLVRDTAVAGDDSFRLELFSLGIDRLNHVVDGVPASADAILNPMDVVAVRSRTAADSGTRGIAHVQRATPVESGVRVTISPCVAMLDEATVATVQSLVASVTAIRLPAALTASAPHVAAPPATVESAQVMDFSASLEAISVVLGGFNDLQSRFVLSGLVVSRRASHFSLLVRQLSWTGVADGQVFLASAVGAPFVSVSADAGGDAMMDVAALTGRLTSDLLHTVVKIASSGSRTKTACAPVEASIATSAPPLPPSLVSALLMPYARCKVMVSSWSVAAATRAGPQLVLAFEHVFASTHWSDRDTEELRSSRAGVDGAAALRRHVGSVTLVGLNIASTMVRSRLVPFSTSSPLFLSGPQSVAGAHNAHGGGDSLPRVRERVGVGHAPSERVSSPCRRTVDCPIRPRAAALLSSPSNRCARAVAGTTTACTDHDRRCCGCGTDGTRLARCAHAHGGFAESTEPRSRVARQAPRSGRVRHGPGDCT